MEKEQKVQSEKNRRIKKEKRFLHYLIVYLVCLLVACLTWLSVRYSMRAEQNDAQTENSEASTVSVAADCEERELYV